MRALGGRGEGQTQNLEKKLRLVWSNGGVQVQGSHTHTHTPLQTVIFCLLEQGYSSGRLRGGLGSYKGYSE